MVRDSVAIYKNRCQENSFEELTKYCDTATSDQSHNRKHCKGESFINIKKYILFLLRYIKI